MSNDRWVPTYLITINNVLRSELISSKILHCEIKRSRKGLKLLIRKKNYPFFICTNRYFSKHKNSSAILSTALSHQVYKIHTTIPKRVRIKHFETTEMRQIFEQLSPSRHLLFEKVDIHVNCIGKLRWRIFGRYKLFKNFHFARVKSRSTFAIQPQSLNKFPLELPYTYS